MCGTESEEVAPEFGFCPTWGDELCLGCHENHVDDCEAGDCDLL